MVDLARLGTRREEQQDQGQGLKQSPHGCLRSRKDYRLRNLSNHASESARAWSRALP